jgi:hypothetical protein
MAAGVTLLFLVLLAAAVLAVVLAQRPVGCGRMGSASH